jgi:hypothetical protein
MRSINAIYIHHSASPKSTTVEQINQWHLDRGWAGIGYHFVINGDTGKIEEGRTIKKNGAHTKGYNRNSIGICVTGNYENEMISKPAWESLHLLCSSLCDSYDISSSEIHAHRDFGKTACPGKNLYAMLPELRRKI